MQQRLLEDLITTLEITLDNFTTCEVRAEQALDIDPKDHAVCHLVIRGEGSLTAANRSHRLGRGTVLIVPPGIAKRISGNDRLPSGVADLDSSADPNDALVPDSGQLSLVFGCASVVATCGGAHHLFQLLQKPIAINVGRHDTFVAGFNTLLQELSEPRLGGKVIVDCLLKQALVLVLREEMSRDVSPLLEQLGDQRIIRTAAAMIRWPEDSHDIKSLSSLSGMSRSSFLVHFERRYGTSPGEFLRTVRMQTAARLLATSAVPIKRLAGTVGYSSRSQFSRTFSHTFGMSPTRYREQHGPARPM